jgi:hypothetical protein
MTRILQLELLEELVERHIGALGPVRGEGVERLVRHLERQRLIPVQLCWSTSKPWQYQFPNHGNTSFQTMAIPVSKPWQYQFPNHGNTSFRIRIRALIWALL